MNMCMEEHKAQHEIAVERPGHVAAAVAALGSGN